MARFAKLFALVSAVAMVAFAGPALATEARYTCSDGSKLRTQFSPPDTAKGSVALTFATGRELKFAASPIRRWRALRQGGHRVLDQGAERDADHKGGQGNLRGAVTLCFLVVRHLAPREERKGAFANLPRAARPLSVRRHGGSSPPSSSPVVSRPQRALRRSRAHRAFPLRGNCASTPETTSSTISCNSPCVAPSRAWIEMPCMTAAIWNARRSALAGSANG